MESRSGAAKAAAGDASIGGKWTYRSYRNRADIIVDGDAQKALSLIFGEGIMTFDPPTGNALTGNFDMGGGYVLDLKGTMQSTPAGDTSIEVFGTGRAGTPTENWEYDYKGTTTPKWANGIDQIPSIVGTVIRAKPHDGAKAGYVASFISIKQ